MESLEHLFKHIVTSQGKMGVHDISLVVEKNLIPYFIRKGFSHFDAASRSYKLMAFITGHYRNAFIENDYKTVINKIKETRIHFADKENRVILLVDDLPADNPSAIDPTLWKNPQPDTMQAALDRIIGNASRYLLSISNPKPPADGDRIIIGESDLDDFFQTVESRRKKLSLNNIYVSYNERKKLERETELSESEILVKISESLASIDKNLNASHESVMNIDNKLEGTGYHVNHTGIP